MDGRGRAAPGAGGSDAAEGAGLHQLRPAGNQCQSAHGGRGRRRIHQLCPERHEPQRGRGEGDEGKVHGRAAAGDGIQPAGDRQGAAVSDRVHGLQPGGGVCAARRGHGKGHCGNGGGCGADGWREPWGEHLERDGDPEKLEGAAGRSAGGYTAGEAAGNADRRQDHLRPAGQHGNEHAAVHRRRTFGKGIHAGGDRHHAQPYCGDKGGGQRGQGHPWVQAV